MNATGDVYIKARNPTLLELQQRNVKKGRKNRNREREETPPLSQSAQLSPEEQNLLQYLTSAFPGHSRETILALIRTIGLNTEEIFSQLLKIPEDEGEPRRSTKETNRRKNKVELECQEFMNQLTEEIEITQYEFEELFEEVSNLIKNNPSMGVQSEEMISQCKGSLSEFLKLKEAFADELMIDGMDEYLLIEKQPLITELQFFTEEKILMIAEEKKKKVTEFNQHNFPSLAQNNGESTVNKLHHNFLKTKIDKEGQFGKTTYFSQDDRKLRNWDENNTLYELNGGNKIDSKDVKLLAKEYETMDIVDLKIIYSHLGDLETCRQFLKRHYSKQKSLERQIEKNCQKQKVRKRSEEPLSRNHHAHVNGGLAKLTLSQLRETVQHEMKLRVIFLQASSKSKNISSKKKLFAMANENNQVLREYFIASRVKELSDTFKNHANKLDLHGYFAVEVEDLVREYLSDVVPQYKSCNPNLTTKTRQGKLIAEVCIVTGKGNNSFNHKSVLRPLIGDLLAKMQLDHDQLEGEFLVRIPLS